MTPAEVDMGEPTELEQWVREGYDRAYRTACLILRDVIDAEEAVQEAYLRAWRFRDSLPSGDGRRPWMYRVLVNTCNSRLRSDIPRRRRNTGPEPLDHLADPADGPESLALGSARSAAVIDALGALPEHLRVVVVLRYWAQLSEKEIATAIRRRPGTVKSRLHEARTRLSADSRMVELVADGVVGAQR